MFFSPRRYQFYYSTLFLGIVQSLNSPFFPPHIGAEPGRAKDESRGPFLERPGNLTGPESDFDIKVTRKVRLVLTSDEVHFVSLADNIYCTTLKPFETPSRMENKTA